MRKLGRRRSSEPKGRAGSGNVGESSGRHHCVGGAGDLRLTFWDQLPSGLSATRLDELLHAAPRGILSRLRMPSANTARQANRSASEPPVASSQQPAASSHQPLSILRHAAMLGWPCWSVDTKARGNTQRASQAKLKLPRSPRPAPCSGDEPKSARASRASPSACASEAPHQLRVLPPSSSSEPTRLAVEGWRGHSAGPLRQRQPKESSVITRIGPRGIRAV